MRPSHRLCSLVWSVPHLSTAITDRPSHDSSFASPSRKRSISSAASVPLSSPIPGALSYACADLLSSPNRIRSFDYVTDLEDSSAESSEPSRSRGIKLEMEVDVVRSDKIDINLKIQAERVNMRLRDMMDAAGQRVTRSQRRELRVQRELRQIWRFKFYDHMRIARLEAYARREIEVTYETLGDLVKRFHDHTVEIPVHRVQAIEGIKMDQGHMIVATGQQSTDMLERIRELERVNMRLRDMMDAAGQRVTRSQRRELRVQRELRQISRFKFYDHMRIARLEACARRTMPNTRSGVTMTREVVNEQIDRRLAGALGAHDAARNLEPLMGNGGNGNGGNRNGRNRNGNGNRVGNCYNFEGFMPAKECTYQDFLKCQPLNFNGTKGVIGLTHWFKKMETVFHISNCLENYQVKYATCTLLNSALTWWNSHKRTIGIEAAYAMIWAELMKLMTKVYCPRNKDKSKEKQLEDVPIIREFPEVFPENLPRLPHAQQVEFQIDLVPGATSVARALYRLAPAKMQELSPQLQELSDRGFIRPSSSPWGAPVLFVKKKEDLFGWLRVYSKIDLRSGYTNSEFVRKIFQRQHFGLTMFTMSSREGIHVDPAMIESIKDWASPKTPTEIHQFLEGSENFVLYCDASHKGLSMVLMQKEKVISYVSCQLKVYEKNYTTHDLELERVEHEITRMDGVVERIRQ
uniref:Reverse transcriptase RNase H-like domain-containing protein n=1 Tax=Tanacetum cinerariifolium TaxID=118510 RepID=A0A6L2NQB1_TANCI|nr:hypothetical protein [Tanacetum cinerariifolium]